MKVVLFGEDVFTASVLQALIDHKIEVPLVVCPQYDNDSIYKSIQNITGKNNIELVIDKNVNSESVRNKIRQIRPDLIISTHLRKLLKKEIFSLAAKGAINVHPSRLPKYAGLTPQQRSIMHGDTESAVTIHFIDESIDTGDIVLQKPFEIKKDDYIYDIQFRLLSIYKEMIIEAVNLVMSEGFKPVKQDLAGSSFFGALKKEERRINLDKSKKEVYNLIRAVSKPYSGAFYDNFVIWHAYLPDEPAEQELMKNYPEKGLVQLNEDELVIRLNDGIIVSDDFEIQE